MANCRRQDILSPVGLPTVTICTVYASPADLSTGWSGTVSNLQAERPDLQMRAYTGAPALRAPSAGDPACLYKPETAALTPHAKLWLFALLSAVTSLNGLQIWGGEF